MLPEKSRNMLNYANGLGNEIDDRIESRAVEIALKWEMGNEIGRVAK